ncbi:hypothetical protein [Novosphingobium sp. B 225]|uniref:hypothetical protein n=1 Tax=Novosphingobium sp. B 225 TaxID=1961849 RepID=UPI000B4BCDC6|nr:hypothetical protein [Novosphingobium sp. B 225]
MTNHSDSWLDGLRRRPAEGGADLRPAALLGLALGLLGLGAALVWTALHRGPWYDEFYTWFVSRPERSLGESLRESWLVDNHPPLFNLLSWLGAHLAPSIETLRLINLVGLALAVSGGAILLRRSPQLWALAAFFALSLAANETALRSGAELRSYFLSSLVGAVTVLAIVIGWLEGELRRRGQRLVLWVTLLIGFNLHILTSVILGALLVPFLAAAWLRGRRALLGQILIPALVAGTLFLAVSTLQFRLWEANTARFWIPAGFNAARWAIEYGVQRAGEANLLITLAALVGTGLLGWQVWRERRLPPALEAMLLLGAGIALATVLLIGLHMLRPVVMERYLAAMIPAVAMGTALGANAALRRIPGWLGQMILLAASALTLWSLAGSAAHTAARNSWEGSAQRLGELVRICPDSPVHIDPPFWNAYTMSLPPADNRMVFAKAYALMAARHGIKIEPPQSRKISATCPTLFWDEHDTSAEWDTSKIAAHLRDQGFAVERVWQYRIGDGWIASNRPLDGPLPAR